MPGDRLTSVPESSLKKRLWNPQVRLMAILTVGFVGGVLFYAVLPAGPIRSTVMGLFAMGLTWFIFRFAI